MTEESHGNKEDSGSQAPGPSPKQNGSSVGRSRVCNMNKNPLSATMFKENKPDVVPLQKPVMEFHPLPMETEENKVWICPACDRQDDGSPMIGCDDCDAWYHW